MLVFNLNLSGGLFMKRVSFILVFMFMGFQISQATTYFKSHVNDQVSSTMTQGDLYAWEYDVSVIGGSAYLELFVDTNNNQVLDDGDVLLIAFDQTDGQTDQDGPPPDSSDVPDGIIYSEIGSLGFPPADYLFRVTDDNDSSVVVGTLHINAPANVTSWIIGHVTKEGVTPPDSSLSYIMMEASDMDEEMGFWGGLTDENGYYSINLPGGASDKQWGVHFMFSETQLAGYITQPDSYTNIDIVTGNNGPFDFTISMPATYVYGDIVDEQGQLVPSNDDGSLKNLHTYDEVDFNVSEGHFKVGAVFSGDDTVDVPFQLNFWPISLIPQYLMPNTWANPAYQLTLSVGDSVHKDIRLYSTDTTLYVQIYKDGEPYSTSMRASANNDSVGQTYSWTDTSGFTALHIRNGYEYGVWLSTDDHGNLDLPTGYMLAEGNSQSGIAGDTVVFRLVPTSSVLSGKISFSPGSEVYFDPNQCDVNASDWEHNYQGKIDGDSLTYRIDVPNGIFSVNFNSYQHDFLSMPVRYENITVRDSEVDTLDFELNYAHARLVMKLVNAPLGSDQYYTDWWSINTEGNYPYVYEASANMEADTTYHFKVCEGSWYVQAPYFGENYQVSPSDTTVRVTENDSSFYVEFVYKDLTGIEPKSSLPTSFYVKQNYPNPFNPVTTIEFGLTKQGPVTLDIYNIKGQRIVTLVNGNLSAGIHKVHWDGSSYASGMYIYRLHTNHHTVSKRLLLLK